MLQDPVSRDGETRRVGLLYLYVERLWRHLGQLYTAAPQESPGIAVDSLQLTLQPASHPAYPLTRSNPESRIAQTAVDLESQKLATRKQTVG